MKKDKLFGHVSDEEAARIAAEYPTGDKKQRDRIFSEIERRVENVPVSGDEVGGVEKYRPRIWMKVASAATAFALVAGAAAGGGYLLLRNGGTAVPGAEVEATSETETDSAEPEDITEASEAAAESTEGQLTREGIIAKIRNRDYDAYDQLSIKYHTTVNGGRSCEHSEAKRDRITGNESLVKVWTHTPEYYEDVDDEILAEYGGLDKLAESITKNEMFMYKDLFVCVYSDTSCAGPDQYEAFDRSKCAFDKPNVFCNLYSEFIINDDLDKFEIQEMKENVEFIGRDCTQLVMTSAAGDERYIVPPGQDNAPVTAIDPVPAQEESGGQMNLILSSDNEDGTIPGAKLVPREDSGEPAGQLQTLTLTVDNETGFILAARLECGDYYEEFTVEEILFNEEAQLPEDGSYIRNRIAGCTPTDEISAAYDLSQLDE